MPTWKVHSMGTGARKLLDQSREEQESAGGDPCWVPAELTTLHERSCLDVLMTVRVHRHHSINSLAQFCTSTGVSEQLDRLSEEQESAKGQRRLVYTVLMAGQRCQVYAGLTTLQERSCTHAHVRYSARASSSCYKFACAML